MAGVFKQWLVQVVVESQEHRRRERMAGAQAPRLSGEVEACNMRAYLGGLILSKVDDELPV